MTGLRSGQVAEAAGVNLQTLRYYERRGLLAEPARSLGGQRLYPAEAVTVLKVIKAAQRLGFTLDEVADLLAAGGHRHGRSDSGLRERARGKLVEVEAKIAGLEAIASTLRAAVASGCDDLVVCAGRPCCPIPFATIASGTPAAEETAGAEEAPAAGRAACRRNACRRRGARYRLLLPVGVPAWPRWFRCAARPGIVGGLVLSLSSSAGCR